MTKMAIDNEILALIRCPESQSRLHRADESTLSAMNHAIETGSVVNRAGEVVTQPIQSGLVNEKRTLLYPIREGITVLVVDQAIIIETSDLSINPGA
jgi:uncharacterized protein YbaR (Trm112 family)